MIRCGCSGDIVMKMLRETCPTPGALSCCVSRVRSKMISEMPIPSCAVVERMLPFKDEIGVSDFLSSKSLSDMVKTQRDHKFNPMWSDAAEQALSSLVLIPQHLSSLKLSERESLSKKRIQENALMKKQDDLIQVFQSGQLLQHAIHLARCATIDMSYARLSLPLLLLSGRRTTELLNGKSTFIRMDACATGCIFSGQIKKRGEHCSYQIPLLCDIDTFENALSVLRSKQKFEQLEAEATHSRYAKVLNKGIKLLFPIAKNVHQLRSIYAAFVYHLYLCNTTFNKACMKILGHDDLCVSLSYNNCILHDTYPFSAGSFGNLPE